MPSRDNTRRSRTRRAGEGLYGALLLVKALLMGLIAVLLVFAGGWSSWSAAQPAMFGEESGTVRIEECGGDECVGSFSPAGEPDSGEGRPKVTIGESVSGEPGETLDVTLLPGTNGVIRTGPAGILYAWIPLGGALLLASLVVAGGLRMRRTAWTLGLLGAALMTAAWGLLTF
jgi:hypothetical protein